MELKGTLVRQYRGNVRLARGYVNVLTGDLTESELNWQARSGHHSIWHHLWHMFLCHDYYFNGAFGMRPAWEEGNWRERIDASLMEKTFHCTGLANEFVPRFSICDVPDSLVDELKALPLEQYLVYVDEMFVKSIAVLEQASEDQLTRRVTVGGQSLPAFGLATDFSHIYRHIGMMEDVRGLIRGPGNGSATI